jgi:CheY-like chemotaxis protein
MKVLVIDDTPELRDVICHVLKRAGLTVVTAADGPEGIRLAKQEMPDVITLDLEMPDMHGLDVCRELKADPVMYGIPIIVVSSNVDAESQVASISAGAVAYLKKPFSNLSLVSLVMQKGGVAQILLTALTVSVL